MQVNSIDRSKRLAWTDKSAIVVGASSGLGRCLVDRLAEQGAACVLLVARDRGRLAAVVDELAGRWPQSKFDLCAADMSTAEGGLAFQQAIEGSDRRFDLLINAAGASDRGLAMKLTFERLDELMRANVHATLQAIQLAASAMAPAGVIVNIGSLSSYFAPRYLGGYSMAKHALRALTQQMRLELKESGLHVMLVCPGPIAREQPRPSTSASPTSRYAELASAQDVPPAALASAGGAKLKGLDPRALAVDILQAAADRRLELIRPRKARWLVWLIALCPGWGETALRRMTQ